MTKTLITSALALALGATALPALAQSAGDWTLGVGVHAVDPKSDNGSLVNGTLKASVDRWRPAEAAFSSDAVFSGAAA